MTAFVNLSRPRKARKSKRPSLAMSVTPKRRTAPRAPKMTAADALSFNRYSTENTTAVLLGLEQGGQCNGTCEPYRDVFTYGRWKALGCQVRKGQHGVRIPIIVERTIGEAEEGKEPKTIKLERSTVVFCSCQVDGEYVADLHAEQAAA